MTEYLITKERLEEMVLCIVHNELDEDEALDYAYSFIFEINTDEAETGELIEQ